MDQCEWLALAYRYEALGHEPDVIAGERLALARDRDALGHEPEVSHPRHRPRAGDDAMLRAPSRPSVLARPGTPVTVRFSESFPRLAAMLTLAPLLLKGRSEGGLVP